MANTQHNNNVLSLANRITGNGKSYPGLTADQLSQIRQQELSMELTKKLQITLELDEIFDLLLAQLNKLLPLDGIMYEHANLNYDFATPLQGKHKACYQLNLEKEDLGLISFTRRTRFKEVELLAFENLMSCLLYPLRNCLKYRTALVAATTDPLTGSGNRQALENSLNREIDLALRNQTPLSVVMFDFDHFKKLNDTHGHQCGDFILKQVIQEIKKSIRKTDLLFRYGGEEFVLLLHKTSLENAAKVADKIREHIAQSQFHFKDETIDISISMGAAALQENDAGISLLERADDALYSAKNLGRNRVCTETRA
ncbi:MAG: GGDEF domain-containing protein [Pseudomonadales bacterium]|jgi:diguanylate cyclase (GGDEF)-like protein